MILVFLQSCRDARKRVIAASFLAQKKSTESNNGPTPPCQQELMCMVDLKILWLPATLGNR